jgi:hypothetical protein
MTCPLFILPVEMAPDFVAYAAPAIFILVMARCNAT